ncbi:MAG: Bax inhibitor-1/YccA family protein [Terriglobales bacterium]
MALLKTSNPALSGDAFRVGGAVLGDTMTVSGTVNKTGILLICVVATSAWSWNLFTRSPEAAMPLLAVGGIGGFIVALVTIFKKAWSPVTAPLYALLEGLVLGSASAMLEIHYPGIAMQAVGLTFGTLIALLLAYQSGIIRATEKFKIGVVAATGGIAIFYLAEFVLGFFGIHFATINGSGAIGIGFSAVVVVVAALNLVLDFDLIESGARAGAPKYMEWYGGFALMITLIWLYFEILRLLSKLRSRD